MVCYLNINGVESASKVIQIPCFYQVDYIFTLVHYLNKGLDRYDTYSQYETSSGSPYSLTQPYNDCSTLKLIF